MRGIVAEALNLKPNVNAQDLTASQRAATSGLIAALQMARGGAGPVLVVAAEKRRTRTASPLELQTGDGAAALLVGTGPVVAKLHRLRQPHRRFRRPLPRRGLRVRLHLGGALDPRRGLQQDRARRARRPLQVDRREARRHRPFLHALRAGARRRRHRQEGRHPRHGRARQPAHRVRRDRRGASAGACWPTRWRRPSPATRSWSSASARAATRCCSRRPENRQAGPAPRRQGPPRAPQGGDQLRQVSSPSTIWSPSSAACAPRSTSRRRCPRSTATARMLTGFIGGKCKKCGTLQFPKSERLRQPQLQRLPHPGGPPVRRHAGQGAVLHGRPPHLFARSAALLRHDRVRAGRPHDDRLHRRRRRRPSTSAAPMRMMFRIKDIRHQPRLHAATTGKLRRPASRPKPRPEGDPNTWHTGHQGQGRHPRHGLLQVRRALGQGGRRPDGGGLRGGHRRRRHRDEPDRGGLARHRHRGAARRQVGRAARGGAAAALHPGDARRELLRQRHRGLPRRRLCRGLRRGRHRAGAGRREAEGHRLRRPAAARPRRAQLHVLAERVGAGLASPSSPPPIAPSTT